MGSSNNLPASILYYPTIEEKKEKGLYRKALPLVADGEKFPCEGSIRMIQGNEKKGSRTIGAPASYYKAYQNTGILPGYFFSGAAAAPASPEAGSFDSSFFSVSPRISTVYCSLSFVS